MKSKLYIGCLLVLFCTFNVVTAEACTIWGAAGGAAAGRGTLIVKNRDVRPTHSQELQLFTPRAGYHYFGLVTGGRTNPVVRAGINEKGLVVVNADASILPREERQEFNATKALNEQLLNQCDSVDAALQKSNLFFGPRYLLIADKNKIALIEIGLNGKTSVKVEENGVLYHTNHYVDADLLYLNGKIGPSSKARYRRIQHLLTKSPKPFTLDHFITFSKDQNAGPNNSIFRTGARPGDTRTLSVWAASVSPDRPPELYVRILNPGKKEKEYRLKADDIFSGKWSSK